jgi:tetratricopeptide (TPR) repeat protein
VRWWKARVSDGDWVRRGDHWERASQRTHSAVRALTHRAELQEQGLWTALCLAAVVGESVVRKDWTALAEAADVEIPPDCEDTLIHLGIATPGRVGWSFPDVREREALLSAARRSGELGAWAKAQLALVPRTDLMPAEHVAYRGELCMLAGDFAQAAEEFLQAVHRANGEPAPETANALFARMKEAVRMGGLQADTAWVGRVALVEAHIAVTEGRPLQHSLEAAVRAVDAAARCGEDDLEMRAQRFRSRMLQFLGLTEEATEALDRAADLCEQLGNRIALGNVWDERAGLALGSGDLETAKEALRRAEVIFVQEEYPAGLGAVLTNQGRLRAALGDLEGAVEHFERAIEVLDRSDLRTVRASCLANLGDARRWLGHTERAGAAYEEAESLFVSSGHYDQVYTVRMNRVLLDIEARRFSEASSLLNEVETRCRRTGLGFLLPYVDAARVSCHAAASEWSAMDDAIERVREAVRAGVVVDQDMRIALDAAVSVAKDPGRVQDLRAWLQGGEPA